MGILPCPSSLHTDSIAYIRFSISIQKIEFPVRGSFSAQSRECSSAQSSITNSATLSVFMMSCQCYPVAPVFMSYHAATKVSLINQSRRHLCTATNQSNRNHTMERIIPAIASHGFICVIHMHVIKRRTNQKIVSSSHCQVAIGN